MRKGGRLLILFGVVLALMAAVLAIIAFRDSGDDPSDVEEDVSMVPVVQTTRDISANEVLTQDDVEVIEVEESTVAPGSAMSQGQVVGLAVNGELVEGQRILVSNLETPGLAHLVDDGMRAIAVPVDRINALGGMIRAEDRVDIVYSGRITLQRVLPTEPIEVRDSTEGFADDDVLVLPPVGETPPTYPFPGEPGSRFTVTDTVDGDPITKVLLQNIRVVRVIAGDLTVEDELPAAVEETEVETEEEDAPEEPEGRLPNSDLVIVEVNPDQAEVMKFILDNAGMFQIALRSTGDDEVLESDGLTYDQMVTELGLPVPRTVTLP